MDLASLRIAVDSRQVKNANQDLDSLGKNASQAEGKVKSLGSKGSSSLSGIASAARVAGAAFAALASTRAFVGIVDQYTRINAQLKIAARSQDDFNNSYQDVIRISNAAQTSIEGTATLYSRLANTLKDTNVTQQQFANITESVALGLRVSGASTAEAQSAMLQLSQAFASGVLRGEEFNAVSEASFPLMKALADSMGIPIEQLRSMAQEGRITRDELVKAFSDPALIATFKAQADNIKTVSGAWQVFKNNLVLIIGEMNNTAGASDALIASIHAMSSVVALLADVFVGAIRGIKQFGSSLAVVFKDIKTVFELLTIRTGGVGALNPFSDEGERLRANIKKQYDGILADRRGFVQAANEDLDKFINSNHTKFRDMLNGDVSNIANGGSYKSSTVIQLTDEQIEAAEKLAKEKEKLRLEEIKRVKEQDDFYFKETMKMFREKQKEEEKLEKEAVERMMKFKQDAANKNFKEAQELNKKLEDERIREAEKTSEFLTRSLSDALLRGFESGKSFADNFKDTLINSFRTLVLRPVIEFIINSSGINGAIQSLIGGITGQGGIGKLLSGGGISGQGGIGGIFKDIGNIFTNTNQSIIGGIERIGATISNGLGGIRDTIGGFVGANASTIANLTSYAGAALQLVQGNFAGAAGTAIGTFFGGPIGGAIGSFLGGALGGLFGSKKRSKIISSQAIGTYANDEFTASNPAYGSGKRFVALGADANLNSLNETFSRTLGSLFRAFGLSDNISTYSFVGQRKKTARGVFSGGGYSYDVGGRGTAQTAFNSMVEAVLGTGISVAVQKSGLPEGIKKFFQGLAKKEDVSAAAQSVLMLNANSVSLDKTLSVTTEQIGYLVNEAGLAGETLSKFTESLLAVANSKFTVGDALVQIKSQIDETFTSFDVGSVPASLQAFDEVMKSLDKSTVAGRDSFLSLLEFRPQFAEFDAQIVGLKGSVKGALFGIVNEAERQKIMNEDLAKLFADLNRDVPASIQELIQLGKSIDYTTAEGLNLAAVFPALVTAFNQTKGAVDGLLNSLSGNRFETFADLAIGSSLARQGVPINQIPTMGGGSQSSGTNDNRVADLLTRLISEVSEMKSSTKQTADNTLRTTRELEDITSGQRPLTTVSA